MYCTRRSNTMTFLLQCVTSRASKCSSLGDDSSTLTDKLKRNKLVYDSTYCVGAVLIIILFGSFAIFQTPYHIQAMAKSHEIFSIFCAFVVTVLLLCLLSSVVEIMKMASLLFSGDRIMNSFCKLWRLVLLPFLTALL